MTLELEVTPDAASAASRVAVIVAERAKASAAFTVAVSKTPSELLRALGAGGFPWSSTTAFQVDERVAPSGHGDRNLTQLLAGLPAEAGPSVRPMPVEDDDLDAAAERYAASLPAQLDVVHLGLGPDGHTASLVPGDPVLEVEDRLVAVTGVYQGRRRMTLTYPALDAAREIVWLVTGAEKRDALARLLARDPSIPAARVAGTRQLVVADASASGSEA